MQKKQAPQVPECKEQLIAIKDTMILLSGKWKIQIIGWLLLYGKAARTLTIGNCTAI
jgi:hypothetical protein